MPVLLSCQNLTKSFGAQSLFHNITMGFYDGERCGLFGPNGTGKSTLMKILAGKEQPDEGTLEARRGIKVGYLAQEDRFTAETPRQELLHALADAHLPEHDRETKAAIMLTRIGFENHNVAISTLSGGWRKRLALAREMVLEPDLLLLDEPTNHLDLEGILWLEKILKAPPTAAFAYVVVTHDRYFLDNVTERVIEINPVFKDGYLSVPGTYSDFLDRRETVLDAQLKEQQTMKMKVREEIAWLRRGPKAQRNKNKSRIKDAHDLIDNYAQTRARTASDAERGAAVDIEFQATERKTKKLIAAHSLVKSMGEGDEKTLLIRKLNLVLSPGMKLGVLGPNGSGKSTLLKLLAGELDPDAGTIKRAPDLRLVYFDQQRLSSGGSGKLDRSQLLKDALAPTSDSVIYNGRLVHVTSYAKRFLFRAEQLDRPVGELSGGEQARILIARLMLTPADILILDEPTNDLDIPSLEVLEESLEEFPGALVLVTHDRFMLDRLSTEILGLAGAEGGGGTALLTDYQQYESWVESRAKEQAKAQREQQATKRDAAVPAASAPRKPAKKLSYKEQQELDAMESSILAAEEESQKWHRAMENPAVMANREELNAACANAHDAQQKVAKLYERWQELEAKLNG